MKTSEFTQDLYNMISSHRMIEQTKTQFSAYVHAVRSLVFWTFLATILSNWFDKKLRWNKVSHTCVKRQQSMRDASVVQYLAWLKAYVTLTSLDQFADGICRTLRRFKEQYCRHWDWKTSIYYLRLSSIFDGRPISGSREKDRENRQILNFEVECD